MRHGAEGYAIYWYCIELIANRTNPENITFELKHDAETIGFYLKVDTLRVEKIMSDMVELGLFENNDNRITCMKLAKRLDNTLSQNKEIKETLRNFNSLEAEEIRLDKIRIDKNKREEIEIEKNPTQKTKHFIKPTIQECSEYCKNKGEAENFWHFYESKNWMVGKNKMSRWKSALTRWMKNNNNRKSSYEQLEQANNYEYEKIKNIESGQVRNNVLEAMDAFTNTLPAK